MKAKLDKEKMNTDKGFAGPADALIEAIQQHAERHEGGSLKYKEVVKRALKVIEERASE